MYTSDTPDSSQPRRRRIIQQPLRTEAPVALIASEGGATDELEARLKRDHPLITFPSLSHFLAEPLRGKGYAAIVVARPAAWDPHLDHYVRRRRSIALFALPEEGYGWPDAVARLRDLSEIDAWLAGLNAPDQPVLKKLAKRSAATPKPAAAPAPAAWLNEDARVWELLTPAAAKPSAAPSSEAAETKSTAPSAARKTLAPTKPPSKRPSRAPEQLLLEELAGPASAKSPKSANSASRTGRRKHATPAQPKVLAKPRAAGRTVERPKPVQSAPAMLRSREEPPASIDATRAVRDVLAAQSKETSRDIAAALAFTRAAAEVGLVRADELLSSLRGRATQLALNLSR